MVKQTMGRSVGVSAEELASISSPDRVETPFGNFEFFDGLPLPETVERSYDSLDLLRAIDVFLNCVPGASMLAMRNGLRSVGVDASNKLAVHRSEGRLGAADADREHGHDLRHRLPRPSPRRPDRDRGATELVELRRRRVAAVRRRHGPRRSRQGRRRQVPVPASGLRRRRSGRLLRRPLTDLLQLDRDPRPRRDREPGDDAHLSARSRRLAAGDGVHQHRPRRLQRHPLQRLQLLRGDQHDRPGGAVGGARPGTGRPDRLARDRQRPAVRTRRAAARRSSRRAPGSRPASPARCCTSRATHAPTTTPTAPGRTRSSAAATSSSATTARGCSTCGR